MLKTAKEVKAKLKAGDNSYKPFAGRPLVHAVHCCKLCFERVLRRAVRRV